MSAAAAGVGDPGDGDLGLWGPGCGAAPPPPQPPGAPLDFAVLPTDVPRAIAVHLVAHREQLFDALPVIFRGKRGARLLLVFVVALLAACEITHSCLWARYASPAPLVIPLEFRNPALLCDESEEQGSPGVYVRCRAVGDLLLAAVAHNLAAARPVNHALAGIVRTGRRVLRSSQGAAAGVALALLACFAYIGTIWGQGQTLGRRNAEHDTGRGGTAHAEPFERACDSAGSGPGAPDCPPLRRIPVALKQCILSAMQAVRDAAATDVADATEEGGAGAVAMVDVASPGAAELGSLFAVSDAAGAAEQVFVVVVGTRRALCGLNGNGAGLGTSHSHLARQVTDVLSEVAASRPPRPPPAPGLSDDEGRRSRASGRSSDAAVLNRLGASEAIAIGTAKGLPVSSIRDALVSNNGRDMTAVRVASTAHSDAIMRGVKRQRDQHAASGGEGKADLSRGGAVRLQGWRLHNGGNSNVQTSDQANASLGFDLGAPQVTRWGGRTAMRSLEGVAEESVVQMTASGASRGVQPIQVPRLLLRPNRRPAPHAIIVRSAPIPTPLPLQSTPPSAVATYSTQNFRGWCGLCLPGTDALAHHLRVPLQTSRERR